MTDKRIETIAEPTLDRLTGGVIESLGTKYTALANDRAGARPGTVTPYIGETEKNLD